MAEEKLIENKIRKSWEDAGGYIIKNHGGQFTTKGQPDLTGCYKGRFVAIEVKQPKGQPTPVQLRHLRNIAQSGGIAIIGFTRDAWMHVSDYLDGHVDNVVVGVLPVDDREITIEFAEKWWHSIDKSNGVVFVDFVRDGVSLDSKINVAIGDVPM